MVCGKLVTERQGRNLHLWSEGWRVLSIKKKELLKKLTMLKEHILVLDLCLLAQGCCFVGTNCVLLHIRDGHNVMASCLF